VTASQEGLCFI